MIERSQNKTRYNTDDLNLLWERVESFRLTDDRRFQEITRQALQDTSYNRFRLPPEGLKVANLTQTAESSSGRRHYTRGIRNWSFLGACTHRLSHASDNYLRVQSVARLRENEDFGLATVVSTCEETPVAPRALVVSILTTLADRAASGIRYRYKQTSIDDKDLPLLQEQVQRLIQAAANELTLRVMPRVESPEGSKHIPKTREEKIERLMSDSFYGPGGVLKGPRWAWRSGSRAPTRKWSIRIDSAQEYYERELVARMKHAETLRKLGVEPPPYQSFAEYLRQCANDIELRDKARRHRGW
jgi:hypothetical protein